MKFSRNLKAWTLRNQYLEQPFQAAITVVIRLDIESYKDWVGCIGTASTKCHSSSIVLAYDDGQSLGNN